MLAQWHFSDTFHILGLVGFTSSGRWFWLQQLWRSYVMPQYCLETESLKGIPGTSDDSQKGEEYFRLQDF